VPFGRDTIFESHMNSVADTLIATGGYLAGQQIKIEIVRPMINYLEKNFDYPLVGVEIGIYRGGNTQRILDKLQIKHIYLVDPYINYPEYSAKLNLEILLIATIETAYKIAEKRLQPYKDKISFIFEKSEDAADKIPDNLDFVYIDGNHSYDYIKNDIETYYPKVRQGGIIGGHDIRLKDIERVTVGFAYKHDLELNIDPPDWWIIKK